MLRAVDSTSNKYSPLPNPPFHLSLYYLQVHTGNLEGSYKILNKSRKVDICKACFYVTFQIQNYDFEVFFTLFEYFKLMNYQYLDYTYYRAVWIRKSCVLSCLCACSKITSLLILLYSKL